MEIRQASQDHLRPRRRHGGDHQTPSFAHASQNRGHERRKASRDGDRFRDRWRRLLHAVARGAFARNDSRGRSLHLSERAYSQPRRRDERSAAWCVSEDSARRKASSRSSVTWTKSRKLLGLTPEEFRRRNFIHEGETTATSQVIRERVDMDQLLTRALQLSDYHAKRERFARENTASNGRFSKKRGIGFATFMHGAGFTGSGEVYLQSVVSAEATAEGKVRILAASTEIGQGTNTIFSQIASEALGIDFDSIEIVQPDTGRVPNSGPTVASRTVDGRRQAGRIGGDGFEADAGWQRLVATRVYQAEFQEGVR